jgi:hypothetical protein
MSQRVARPKLSEKGLLTPGNCVVAIIDLQPQMLFGVSNFDRQTVINNNLVLAKAARVFDVPVVLSTVESKGFSGNMWPQIQAVFPKQVPIERSSMNSWDDSNFVAAIQKTGRKKNRDGGALDRILRRAAACAGNLRWRRDLRGRGLLRRCQPAFSRQRDETCRPSRRKTGHCAIRNARMAARLGAQGHLRRGDGHCENPCGAYGVGVEYAFTMVHGAPATKVSEYVVPVAAAAHA